MKRGVVFVVSFLCLVSFVAALPHNEAQVLIGFDNGFSSNLKEAFDNGLLVPSVATPSQNYTTALFGNFGHSSDEVWVSVDGNEGTLGDALSGGGLCGSYNSAYVGSLDAGHFASEIDFAGYGSFQDAIDKGAFCGFAGPAFRTLWKTNNPGENILLPLNEYGIYDFLVDWGDGSSEIVNEEDRSATVTIPDKKGGPDIVIPGKIIVVHTYSVPGTYEISIKGKIGNFKFDNKGSKNKIIDILEWGILDFGTYPHSMFEGCSQLTTVSAIDVPDLEGVKSLSWMFYEATNLKSINNLNSWDVGGVENMEHMFERTNFNQNINNWDVSDVENMRMMFTLAESFNQPLNNWDVSSVTNMNGMFSETTSFNQPLNNWDVSSVTNMGGMFRDSNFNQPLNNWDVSSVTGMGQMFMDSPFYLNPTSFNQNLGGWDVSGVTYCSEFSDGTSSWGLPKPSFTLCAP